MLHLCSVSELSGALSEIRRILYRQNEVQETLLSLFPIYRRLPKLDVAGSNPVSRSIKCVYDCRLLAELRQNRLGSKLLKLCAFRLVP